MTDKEYYSEFRLEVLKSLTPKLNAWGITDFDFIVDFDENGHLKHEYLRIHKDIVGCMFDSLHAIEEEAIGWLFLYIWERSLGAFEIQTTNVIKRFWRKK